MTFWWRCLIRVMLTVLAIRLLGFKLAIGVWLMCLATADLEMKR